MLSSLVFLAQVPAPAAMADAAPEPTTSLSQQFWAYLPHLGIALLILLGGWWVAGWLRAFFRRVLLARHVDATLAAFLTQLFYWIAVLVVLIPALKQIGIDPSSVLTVLGASALAVGLALQSSLSNFAAGVMIILFRHFRVGDSIEAGGVAGVVEEISIFDTILVTSDNRKIIVPNGKILGSPIINASAKPTRRLDLTFGIGYDSDLKQAKEIILAVLRADPRVQSSPPPTVAVGNLGDNAVDLAMRAWVNIGDYDSLRSQVLENVKLRFDEVGITIPCPQREVHLHPAK